MTTGYPPGYGYPAAGWGTAPPAATPRTPNPAGIVIAVVGGALTLIGAFVKWYAEDSLSVKLSDIVNVLDVDGAKAFPKAYFDWLMWVVLAATVVAAIFANVAGPLSTPLRVLSPVLGALGVILLLSSLNEIIEGESIFKHSAAGLWLTIAGFVVAGVAGILGPRRQRH